MGHGYVCKSGQKCLRNSVSDLSSLDPTLDELLEMMRNRKIDHLGDYWLLLAMLSHQESKILSRKKSNIYSIFEKPFFS